MSPFEILAGAVLVAHLLWILWVILGCLVTRARPWLAGLHMVSLVWGIAMEVGPWPCPLTIAEQWLEARAGAKAYQGSFLIHYPDLLVYPNVSPELLAWVGSGVCLFNLAIYGMRWWRRAARS